jgi:hypothetical protein
MSFHGEAAVLDNDNDDNEEEQRVATVAELVTTLIPTKSFDASKYLVKISGGVKYLPLSARLMWLRAVDPNATIVTAPVKMDENHAIFKAKVELTTGGSATAYGSETKGDFKDFMEKAESKSLNRALKALGFGAPTEEEDTTEDTSSRSAPSRNTYSSRR